MNYTKTRKGDTITQKVLILGANGRFGRAARNVFKAAGWQTTALVRPGKGQADRDTLEVDAADAGALAKAAAGYDVIVNALNPPYDKWAKELPRLSETVIAAAQASGATLIVPGNVYNFGKEMPEVLDADTAQYANDGKGRLRVDTENTLRAAMDIQVIILRGGDYIEAAKTGNWFDSFIADKVNKGVITYPGPLDSVHAWAYLPDMARAAAELARKRKDLPRFNDIPFAGYALTGSELIEAVEMALGRRLKVKSTPWTLLKSLGVFLPLVREVVAM